MWNHLFLVALFKMSTIKVAFNEEMGYFACRQLNSVISYSFVQIKKKWCFEFHPSVIIIAGHLYSSRKPVFTKSVSDVLTWGRLHQRNGLRGKMCVWGGGGHKRSPRYAVITHAAVLFAMALSVVKAALRHVCTLRPIFLFLSPQAPCHSRGGPALSGCAQVHNTN